jgi:hypothetical protein
MSRNPTMGFGEGVCARVDPDPPPALAGRAKGEKEKGPTEAMRPASITVRMLSIRQVSARVWSAANCGLS